MAIKEPKAKKAPERKVWKSFGHETYQEVMHGLVHFSAKTTNSNTPPCGIRLGVDKKVTLPYLAVSTLASVPVDYSTTGTDSINKSVFKQIAALIEGNAHDLFDGIPPGEAEEIQTLLGEILSSPFEMGTATLGMRLRQVIVQDALGNDLAFTPLQSAGFSRLLNDRIRFKQDANKDERKRYWQHGFLGVGGSRPDNVGRYAGVMSRPLFFAAPADNRDTRAAYAIHHRGISLKPPHELLVGYVRWRKQILSVAGGAMPSDAASREKEADFIREIVTIIVARAESASQQLEAAADQLPGENLLASDMDGLMRGLITPSERTTDWKRELAQRLHREIIDAKVHVNGEWQTMGVGEYESARWVSLIEEAL
ncbi:MAG: hypothetical protein Q8L93_06640 [Rhodocyclaceae bacterium]|nr:hypothetical protein [Rhodocyclaceae bacterium]